MRLVALLLCASAPAAGERWTIRYHHDEDRTAITFNDLAFPTADRGVAVGSIKEGGSERGVQVATSDGGKTWQLTPLKEIGAQLFFLNETLGWMATGRGVWQTADGGRTWTKTKAPKDLFRVHFLDAMHGFAAGSGKSFYETRDGGKTWSPVAAVKQLKTRPEHTHFTAIAFAGPKVGMVAGYSRPPRESDSRLPAWVDPEAKEFRREVPNLAVSLETRDGGATWAPGATSMFGRITRIRARPPAESVGLVEFADGFEYASEVFRVDWRTGHNARIYREKTRAITDVLLPPGGATLLGGYEATGALRRLPVPGKVKILKSNDYRVWQEMDVDYRAVCRRLVFATSPGGGIWAATDSGMLLQLEP
jgi:hypothetical protein